MVAKGRQNFITKLISKALNCNAEIKKFDWLVNKPHQKFCKSEYNNIMKIFKSLNGDLDGINKKGQRKLNPDAYFSDVWNFIFEFDEVQHFTKYKQIALENYPKKINLGFDIEKYKILCEQYCKDALKKGPTGYRKSKIDFPFENGRAAQRAFLDSFRDLLPPIHGLNPTIRISEFEVEDIFEINETSLYKIKLILIEKFKLANCQKLIKQFNELSN